MRDLPASEEKRRTLSESEVLRSMAAFKLLRKTNWYAGSLFGDFEINFRNLGSSRCALKCTSCLSPFTEELIEQVVAITKAHKDIDLTSDLGQQWLKLGLKKMPLNFDV